MRDECPIRVLVADDEPLGSRRIVNLLKAEPGVELVGTAEDGSAAVAAIRDLRPDLVFLDIQMPRRTGLDVVREVGPERMPVTVFVTAYDQFALHAFDLAAVDYLVKPFDNERFHEALRRARRKVELERLASAQAQLRAPFADPPAPTAAGAPPAYLERIPVQMRGRTRVVPVARIDYIVASGEYAELHAAGERHLVRESLQSLEERLDPARFARIHRSAIVRLDQVDALLRGGGGEYRVELRSGARLRVSRYRREALERLLGGRE